MVVADEVRRPWRFVLIRGSFLPALTVTVAAAGIGFRLAQYLSGRSLWLDESLLALSIIDRSVLGLIHPLDFSQAAPYGFLAVTKLAVLSLGESELALRLSALLAGIASIPLFYVVARRVTSSVGVLLALTLFACGDYLIYYSAELKQYSFDLCGGLALLALVIPLGNHAVRRYAAASAAGAILIWFSHATIFFILAILSTYAIAFAQQRRWADVRTLAATSLIWIGSFGVLYETSLRDISSAGAGQDSGGLKSALFSMAYDVGVPTARPLRELIGLVALVACVVGIVSVFRAQRHLALILALPIVFMLGAVLIGQYPSFNRTVLFTAPVIIIFIVQGAVSLARHSPSGRLAAIGVAAILAGNSVQSAVANVANPGVVQEIKPVLRSLVKQWRPGDTLYVHYGAQYAVAYYAQCDCFEKDGGSIPPPLSLATRRTSGPRLWHHAILSTPPALVVGYHYRHRNWPAYIRAVDRFRGRSRVWVLWSHVDNPQELEFLTVTLPHHLNEIGFRRRAFSAPGATLLLYDLRKRHA